MRIQAQADLQVREEVPEITAIVKALDIMERVGMEMEEIMVELMEAAEVEEIGEIMEATKVEKMEAMEGMEVMEGIGLIEEEAEGRDTLESMVPAKIPTGQDYVVKITWLSIALLKESMELLHPNMEAVCQASMGTALGKSIERTEVSIQPPRGVTILPREEATIQPRYAAISQPPRNHSEVMERTEATRQGGVTTRPR